MVLASTIARSIFPCEVTIISGLHRRRGSADFLILDDARIKERASCEARLALIDEGPDTCRVFPGKESQ